MQGEWCTPKAAGSALTNDFDTDNDDLFLMGLTRALLDNPGTDLSKGVGQIISAGMN